MADIPTRTSQEELTVISMCSRDVEWDAMERIGYNSIVFQAPSHSIHSVVCVQFSGSDFSVSCYRLSTPLVSVALDSTQKKIPLSAISHGSYAFSYLPFSHEHQPKMKPEAANHLQLLITHL